MNKTAAGTAKAGKSTKGIEILMGQWHEDASQAEKVKHDSQPNFPL